jgi:hypothetical protein
LICASCCAAKRKPEGSPVPHYCDACGFLLTSTGERIVQPGSAALVFEGELFEAMCNGGEVPAGVDWVRPDPALVALHVAHKLCDVFGKK